ncbi:MAG: AraC family transcriptional regulator [Bacillota bacterium]|nr:AraC family transcriptional regulator [Bacillota bacterium]
MRHEIVSKNPDIEVRFYLSVDTGSYISPHWHESLEMVYMIEGTMEVVAENRKTILNPGEFNIVNSRVVHSTLSSKNRALVLQIPKEVLRKYIPDIDMYYFAVDMHPVKEVEKTRLEKLKKIFNDMYIVYDIRPEGYLLKFNSLLYELLFTLIHSYADKIIRKDFDKSSKYLERLNRIMEYIKEHHRETLTITQISEAFGYNVDYISRFFKNYTGLTIIEYLYIVRVTEVYRELICTEKTINEIFEEHGCFNYRVTMRVFKELYGCTPKEKRKEMQ